MRKPIFNPQSMLNRIEYQSCFDRLRSSKNYPKNNEPTLELVSKNQGTNHEHPFKFILKDDWGEGRGKPDTLSQAVDLGGVGRLRNLEYKKNLGKIWVSRAAFWSIFRA